MKRVLLLSDTKQCKLRSALVFVECVASPTTFIIYLNLWVITSFKIKHNTVYPKNVCIVQNIFSNFEKHVESCDSSKKNLIFQHFRNPPSNYDYRKDLKI